MEFILSLSFIIFVYLFGSLFKIFLPFRHRLNAGIRIAEFLYSQRLKASAPFPVGSLRPLPDPSSSCARKNAVFFVKNRAKPPVRMMVSLADPVIFSPTPAILPQGIPLNKSEPSLRTLHCWIRISSINHHARCWIFISSHPIGYICRHQTTKAGDPDPAVYGQTSDV